MNRLKRSLGKNRNVNYNPYHVNKSTTNSVKNSAYNRLTYENKGESKGQKVKRLTGSATNRASSFISPKKKVKSDVIDYRPNRPKEKKKKKGFISGLLY